MSGTGQTRNLSLIVGANLRVAREALDLTQRELASRLGGKTDGQRISDWERGVNLPNPLSFVALADLLGHDVAWFYTDHEAAAA